MMLLLIASYFNAKGLIHLQEQCIASTHFQRFLDSVGVGDQQIISNDLLVLTQAPKTPKSNKEHRNVLNDFGNPAGNGKILNHANNNSKAKSVSCFSCTQAKVLANFSHELFVGIPVILIKRILPGCTS